MGRLLRRGVAAVSCMAMLAGGIAACVPSGSSTCPRSLYLKPTNEQAPAPPSGTSPFRTPVSQLTPLDDGRNWTTRLFNFARSSESHRGDWAVEFGFAPSAWTTLDSSKAVGNYGYPTYDAAQATEHLHVFLKRCWGGATNILPTESVPWNPSWRPALGNDGYLEVLDHQTGEMWVLWSVFAPSMQSVSAAPWWPYTNYTECVGVANWKQPGEHERTEHLGFTVPDHDGIQPDRVFDPTRDLCVGAAIQIRSAQGAAVDTSTYTGNYPLSTGGGWPLLAVTPDQVASGDIGHALHMWVSNTMFGPECTPEQMSEPDGFGVTCGTALAPAGQFERIRDTKGTDAFGDVHTQGDTAEARRSFSVPEGMRFSLDVSDADIDSWLDERHYEGALRTTAATFARALRDYGWFIGSTTQGGATFSTASAENPVDAEKWKVLGIPSTGVDAERKDLLFGLVKRADQLRVWAPPENHCSDGRVQTTWCWADTISYAPLTSTQPTAALSVSGD